MHKNYPDGNEEKAIIKYYKYYNGDLFFNTALCSYELNLHLSVFGLQT